MSDDQFPPLRVREQDSSPNAIPVFEIVVSNGTLTQLGPGRIALATGPGGGGFASTATTISTTYPLSGGGDLSTNRTFTVDTAFFVNTGFTITTNLPLSGGGNLSANRTLSIVTATATTTGALSNVDWATFNAKTDTSRTISTTLPLSGGGDLSANRTLTIVTATATTSGALAAADFANFVAKVNTNRLISTTYPLSGGGDLSADRTHTIDTAFLVTSGFTITTNLPLSGGGNLSANRTFSIVTANATTTGAISSVDWSNFNVKVNTNTTISTTLPLSGGGDLSANRTFSIVTATATTAGALAAADFANFNAKVNTNRTISTTYPLSGGGDLSANRTFTVDTAFLVGTGFTITTTLPLSGGGNLSANRTFSIVTANANTTGAILNTDWANFNAKTNTNTTISTTYPLAGGGDLSANRTYTVDTAFLVNTGRNINTGTGLSGGGNLSADRTISLAVPVAVSSGGTGAQTFTAFGILYGSGNTVISVTAAPNSGQILVGSGPNMPPRFFGPGSDGQMIVAQSSALGGFIFVNTSAAGGAGSITVPLIVSSGGTGQQTLTNRGIIIGSGTTAVESLSALAQGQLVVGSSTVLAPKILNIGSEGQTLTVQSGQALGIYWANPLIIVGTPSNTSVNGMQSTFVAGSTLTFGQPVYFGTDAKAYIAAASGVSTFPAFGLTAQSSINTGSAGLILLHGFAQNTSWTWVTGSALYMSVTAGVMTQTQPVGTNNVIQVLGFATTATYIYFAPELDMMTHI